MLQSSIRFSDRRCCSGAETPVTVLPMKSKTASSMGPGMLAQIGKKAILDSLSRNSGDRRATAEELGISLRTLQYRLKEFGITGRD
jgi:transcriptional regulator with PAS, ATPase and Fis domain